jgi:hypothetical protein
MEQQINLRTSRGDSVRRAIGFNPWTLGVRLPLPPLQIVNAGSWEDLCIAAGFRTLDEVRENLTGFPHDILILSCVSRRFG